MPASVARHQHLPGGLLGLAPAAGAGDRGGARATATAAGSRSRWPRTSGSPPPDSRVVRARGHVGHHPRHDRGPDAGRAGRHRHRQAADHDRADALRQGGPATSGWSPSWRTTPSRRPRDLARELAGRSPDALAAAKRLFNATWTASPRRTFARERVEQLSPAPRRQHRAARDAAFARVPAAVRATRPTLTDRRTPALLPPRAVKIGHIPRYRKSEMTTRTKQRKPSARDRLLASANELFYSEGVHSVGIDRVIEHAGVAKASLYNSFGSKEELVHAYLARTGTTPRPRTDHRRGRGAARRPAGQDPRRLRQPGRGRCAGRASAAAPSPPPVPRRGRAGCVEEATALLPRVVPRRSSSTWRPAPVPHDADLLGRQLHLLYDGAAASGNLDHDPTAATDATGRGREPARRRSAPSTPRQVAT